MRNKKRNRIVPESLVIAVTILFLSAGCVLAEGDPLKTEKPEDALIAASLLHSAQNLVYMPSANAKIGRLIAISKYLAEVGKDDLEVQKFLGNVYQIRKNYQAAEVALSKQLKANPDDFATWKQWLMVRLDMLNTAPARIEFLKNIVDTNNYTPAQRSAAAVEMSNVYIGQGAEAEGKKMLEMAIKLNPLNSSALINRLDMTKDASAAMRTETMLALLKGNPRSSWVTNQLSEYLAEHGLHFMALGYLDHSWRLVEGNKPIYYCSTEFATKYANALLDANQPAEAIKLFRPAMERLNTSLDFQSLMIQAFEQTGDKTNADLLKAQMANTYESKLTTQKLDMRMSAGSEEKKNETVQLSMDMSWFYLLIQPEPSKALKYALEAKKIDGDSDDIEVALGAAELATGQNKGLTRLQPFTAKHPMAAFFAAEYELKAGQTEAGKKYLIEGCAITRSGMTYRLLAQLAKKYQISIPPVEDAETVKKLVNSINPDVLKIGVEPDKFVSVTCSPGESSFKPGQPIILNATLTNNGKLPIQIGQWGMMDNQMGLAVSVGKDVDTRNFSSLPVIIWPAPRVLQPGKSITGQTRLDTGTVADFLATNPVDTIVLHVQGLVSPAEVDKKIVSGLPAINPETLSIRRTGLLRENARSAMDEYKRQLSAIAYAQTNGALSQRMLAARQVASLLKWQRAIEHDQIIISRRLKRVVDKDVLLGMMTKTLTDPSPVVRAEILAALIFTELDPDLLNQIGLVINDPSPIVRFRVAELLGASGNKGNLKMLEMFEKDDNEFVAMMARAFLLDKQETQTGQAKP